MNHTVNTNLLQLFKSQLTDDKQIRIVSPFINEVIGNHVLANIAANVEIRIIKRFNLRDFLSPDWTEFEPILRGFKVFK
jgi:hypothetical protein